MRLLGLHPRQFDVVAVDAVVADLQVGQAGAGLLPCLQVHQVLAGVFAEGLQFVQFGVVAALDHAAVADHRRRVVDDRPGQQVGQFRIGADADGQLAEMRRFQFEHAALQLGQGGQRVAQSRQVARAGVAQADTGEDALDVADFLELRLQGFEAVALQQAGDGFLARLQYRAVA
ncbi:hypothetical protein D3C76_1192400 [compost metagenome]